jgi:DNA-binding response OmpR family regulator
METEKAADKNAPSQSIMADANVLVVEDDDFIRRAITAYLTKAGCAVIQAADGQAALDSFSTHTFDLILLDLRLPYVAGETVCQRVRKTSGVPIIMLTAKGEVEDRIMGLSLGADDYIVKPFSLKELHARICAVLRRAGFGKHKTPVYHEIINCDELTIDKAQHKAMLRGEDIPLTSSEYSILLALASYPGRVFSRTELAEQAFGPDFESDVRAVDCHIKNLRMKLEEDAHSPRYIGTVRGAGYRFNLDLACAA